MNAIINTIIAEIVAVQPKVARAKATADYYRAFSSACFKSAFGDQEAVISWCGMEYVADRNDYYDSIDLEGNALMVYRELEDEFNTLLEELKEEQLLQGYQVDTWSVPIGEILSA